jgi:hypothetical protein
MNLTSDSKSRFYFNDFDASIETSSPIYLGIAQYHLQWFKSARPLIIFVDYFLKGLAQLDTFIRNRFSAENLSWNSRIMILMQGNSDLVSRVRLAIPGVEPSPITIDEITMF